MFRSSLSNSDARILPKSCLGTLVRFLILQNSIGLFLWVKWCTRSGLKNTCAVMSIQYLYKFPTLNFWNSPCNQMLSLGAYTNISQVLAWSLNRTISYTNRMTQFLQGVNKQNLSHLKWEEDKQSSVNWKRTDKQSIPFSIMRRKYSADLINK